MGGGNRIVGRVRAVGRGGDAIVESDAGVIIAPGGLPGERVSVSRTGAQRGVSRGRVVDVLEPSASRREPECPWEAACGGCPLMIADLALQQQIKQAFLSEALRGLPGADFVRVGWVASPSDTAYRRRARLAWQRKRFGYRARGSKQVVDVPSCLVLDARLARAWDATRAQLGDVLAGDGEIDLAASGESAVVGLRAGQAQTPSAFEACARLSTMSGVAGVELAVDGAAPARWGTVEVCLGSASTRLTATGPESFFQANGGINDLLVAEVTELAAADDARVLELHAGIGNFTLPLARVASRVVAVEQDANAVRSCRENLAAHGLDARVVEADANAPPKGQYDVVVLDPPRQGARALFEGQGPWRRAKRIVYVSCDTATLRRDLEHACGAGFRVDRATAFDMFPHTAHVESVVRLVR